MVALSARLALAASLVPRGCRFADVGTDHAFLPVWLVSSGRIDSAIATDLRRGPLNRAGETAARFGLTGQIDLRLCDGLEGLSPHEADCIAITGMGGETIRSILSAAPWTREDTLLLLQPQSNQGELRLWLAREGYRIEREHCLFEDEHWYTFLEVTGGEDPAPDPAEALMGCPERWAEGEPWRDFLAHQLQRMERQWDGLMCAQALDPERMEELAWLMETLGAWLDEMPEEDSI